MNQQRIVSPGPEWKLARLLRMVYINDRMVRCQFRRGFSTHYVDVTEAFAVQVLGRLRPAWAFFNYGPADSIGYAPTVGTPWPSELVRIIAFDEVPDAALVAELDSLDQRVRDSRRDEYAKANQAWADRMTPQLKQARHATPDVRAIKERREWPPIRIDGSGEVALDLLAPHERGDHVLSDKEPTFASWARDLPESERHAGSCPWCARDKRRNHLVSTFATFDSRRVCTTCEHVLDDATVPCPVRGCAHALEPRWTAQRGTVQGCPVHGPGSIEEE